MVLTSVAEPVVATLEAEASLKPPAHFTLESLMPRGTPTMTVRVDLLRRVSWKRAAARHGLTVPAWLRKLADQDAGYEDQTGPDLPQVTPLSPEPSPPDPEIAMCALCRKMKRSAMPGKWKPDPGCMKCKELRNDP